MENAAKRRKSIFEPSSRASCRDPLTDAKPAVDVPAEAKQPEKAEMVVKRGNGFAYKVPKGGAAPAGADAAGSAATPAEERQDSQASTQHDTPIIEAQPETDAVPQYPTGERPANLHEHVPAAIPAEERLQTLCENAVNIETDKLQSAFQGDAAYIAEAGIDALKEFQLQVEQACIQGEIRCGSAPIPGLAEKKERLRAMLRQYQEYEQRWNDELSMERARLATLQPEDASAVEAAAAAAAEAAGTSAGLVATEVAACEQKLTMQASVLDSMVSNINAMVDMAEKSCTYFAGELHRMDMSTLPHVYSPDSAVRDVARALA